MVCDTDKERVSYRACVISSKEDIYFKHSQAHILSMPLQRCRFLQEDPVFLLMLFPCLLAFSFINNTLLLLTWSGRLQDMARPQMQRKIDWDTPRARELGCGNTKHLTSFFLSVLPPVLCDLMQHHCKMYKKKSLCNLHFPSSLPLLFTELFPFDDYTFTAFPLLIYHLYCPAFYCPRHPLSRDGKEVQSENKWRNGDKRKQHNDTHQKKSETILRGESE